ncbi:8032_t:CDS:2, partial [Dentiscutata erythropus]
KSEQVTEISTHKAVLMIDYFDKAVVPPEKAAELHTSFINFPNECSSIPTKIKEIITSRRHFLENEQFTLVLRYVVDAIAKLESNNITLGDIFAELLLIYKKLKSSEYEDFDYGLVEHAKDVVNFRAKEFDEPIYILFSIFFKSKISQNRYIKKLTFNNMIVYALTFAQMWNFTRDQALQISQKLLLDYYNNEPPFNLTTLKPHAYWKKVSHQAGALKNLALKIFAIRPHSAEVERLFSHMDLMNEEDNELEFDHIQEIYLESLPNNSDLFLEEFINFDAIEELTSNEVKKISDEAKNTTNWT